jgi:methionyl-tRNA formyltransferase
MPSTALRIIFAGTPEFAATHLAELIASQHEVVAVYTQPDRPAGRGKKLTASPVKKLAEQAGLPVVQPKTLRDTDAQAELANWEADAMIVVAYGLILPQAVLDAPRLGCLNVHASLLPRWRGAAPIQRAIEAGDSHSGITIMQMDAGLDTGAMLATARCAIANTTTAASLHDELAELGSPLLLHVLDSLEQHQAQAQVQDDNLATYADKILKPEAQIDWQLSAEELDRRIRAFNPFPVCYSELGDQRVKIWRASARPGQPGGIAPGTLVSAESHGLVVQCGDGQLVIEQLQLPGGKPLETAQVLNARSDLFATGAVFAPAKEQ